MPNGGAPLFGLTALLKEETAAQIEHGYFRKDDGFPSVALSANAAAIDTILNVASTSNMLPGMIIRADSTNENMLLLALSARRNCKCNVVSVLSLRKLSTMRSTADGWQLRRGFCARKALRHRGCSHYQLHADLPQFVGADWHNLQATQVIAGNTNVAGIAYGMRRVPRRGYREILFFGQKFLEIRNGQIPFPRWMALSTRCKVPPAATSPRSALLPATRN